MCRTVARHFYSVIADLIRNPYVSSRPRYVKFASSLGVLLIFVEVDDVVLEGEAFDRA